MPYALSTLLQQGADGTPREPRPSNRALFRGAAAEALAMVLFVFFGCGAASSNARKFDGGEWDPASVTIIALQFGLSITVLVYVTAHTSGGHINGAVTLGLMAVGKCHPLRAAVYLVAQLVGSIAGAAILDGATYGEAHDFTLDRTGGLGSNGRQNPAVSLGRAFAFEFMGTFLLMYTVLETAVNVHSVTTEGESSILGNKLNLAPLPIGFAVFLAHVVCIPVTGCSINPTRSFGPAVVSDTWDDHWLWWVGPCSGSIGASIVWAAMKQLDDPNDKGRLVAISKGGEMG